jgi:hypothetical protein
MGLGAARGDPLVVDEESGSVEIGVDIGSDSHSASMAAR